MMFSSLNFATFSFFLGGDFLSDFFSESALGLRFDGVEEREVEAFS